MIRHPITSIEIKSNNSEVVGAKPESKLETKILIAPKELIIKNETVLTWIPGIKPVTMPKQIPKKVKRTARIRREKGVM